MKTVVECVKNQAEIFTDIRMQGCGASVQTTFAGANQTTVFFSSKMKLEDLIDIKKVPNSKLVLGNVVQFENEAMARDGHAWIVENIKEPVRRIADEDTLDETPFAKR